MFDFRPNLYKESRLKRLIDYHLISWKNNESRMPLLLRGPRQVGKTHAARELGKTFDDFIEVNLELDEEVGLIFERTLLPDRILQELSVYLKKQIKPGKTLLFLDEIQARPRAITALRYFYEKIPQLHVIAAGSLLDFGIQQVGSPVGRVESLYMHPLSFMEFLAAIGEHLLIKAILDHDIQTPMTEALHLKALRHTAVYVALGGMPKIVECWHTKQDPLGCSRIHDRLIEQYREDFGKYAKRTQIKYLDLLFNSIPLQQGRKFKYSLIEGEYRKRELAPALDLLETAGIAQKVHYSSSQGIPLGAQMDPQDYKVLFFDVGLAQRAQSLDFADWFLHPLAELVNKGSVVEAFVGQEIRAYSDPLRKEQLFYWHSKERAHQAEVDYVLQRNGLVVPIEVKPGKPTTLKSLHIFLTSHTESPFGVRFSTQNYSLFNQIHSYPLYAIAQIAAKEHEVRRSLDYLTM